MGALSLIFGLSYPPYTRCKINFLHLAHFKDSLYNLLFCLYFLGLDNYNFPVSNL